MRPLRCVVAVNRGPSLWGPRVPFSHAHETAEAALREAAPALEYLQACAEAHGRFVSWGIYLERDCAGLPA